MPDAKYGSNEVAWALSQAPDYVEVMQAAIREMHRQVGDLVITDGIAVRGLLVRHLVLPQNLAGSDKVLPWIAGTISRDTYVNIMDQYHWPAGLNPPESGTEQYGQALLRPITAREYAQAIRFGGDAGLHRGFPRHRGGTANGLNRDLPRAP
jgi:putative pyruvate formate lyase activating enzyme